MYEIGNGTVNVHDLIHILFTDKELFGEERAPVDAGLYDRIPRRKLKAPNPEKVHHISVNIEGANRIGLLRDLCNELANVGVNIVMVQSMPRLQPNVARIGFVIEIIDFAQYEVAMRAIRKVDGVFSVLRLQSEPVTTKSESA